MSAFPVGPATGTRALRLRKRSCSSKELQHLQHSPPPMSATRSRVASAVDSRVTASNRLFHILRSSVDVGRSCGSRDKHASTLRLKMRSSCGASRVN
jgi:hypothetical protein